MITNAMYAEAEKDTGWMLKCVQATKGRDLSNVKLFIAPSAGITALRDGNPAIYVRRNQMAIAVNNWRREMQNTPKNVRRRSSRMTGSPRAPAS